jgi:hypothetical protein
LFVQSYILQLHNRKSRDHLIEFMRKASEFRWAALGNVLAVVAPPDAIERAIEDLQRPKPSRQYPVHEPEHERTEDDEHPERQADVVPFLHQFVGGIGGENNRFVGVEPRWQIDSGDLWTAVQHKPKPFRNGGGWGLQLRGKSNPARFVDERRLKVAVAVKLPYEPLQPFIPRRAITRVAHGRLRDALRARDRSPHFGLHLTRRLPP